MNSFLKVTFMFLLLTSCEIFTSVEKEYKTKATILLINETNVVIKSDKSLNYTILPGDTIVRIENNVDVYSERPSINNYFPFSTVILPNFAYGYNTKCETGLIYLENYENRKEINNLEFEFTFRFTEKKRQEASSCELNLNE